MTEAEALEASILHWQENVKAETPGDASALAVANSSTALTQSVEDISHEN